MRPLFFFFELLKYFFCFCFIVFFLCVGRLAQALNQQNVNSGYLESLASDTWQVFRSFAFSLRYANHFGDAIVFS